MMKNVKNIFKNLALACAVVMVMVADCSYAQTMGESTGLKTIICGKKTLCTIGKEAGQSERVCIEIKNKEKNKCKYECQGAGEESPSDCSKDKYTCQRITQSKEDCNLKNNGNAVNPAFLSKDYENYKEASYSSAEREGLPKCGEIEGGSATCICNGDNILNGEIQFTPVVCNKGQVCLHQTNTVGYDHNDYYCMYKEQLDVEGARKKDSIWHNTEVMATNGEELTAEMNTTGCPLVSKYLQKYTSGCWSCLVVEKLTSAFLRVASAGLPVCEKAGKTLLFWGFVIWLCFWALKNVASFTEIKGGNALNDLLKMGAKVVLAYFCILSATEAIREFVITPIMGIGSSIAQGYVYDKEIMNSNKTMEAYGWEDFNWDDVFEPIDPEEAAKLQEQIDQNNVKDANEEQKEKAEAAEDTTGGTGVVEAPHEVTYDSDEQIVVDLQNAFLGELKKQLAEIRASCSGGFYCDGGEQGKACEKNNRVGSQSRNCGNCRSKSCNDSGHRNYIANNIMTKAGYGANVDHYCQASITAAMKKLHDKVGGKATQVLNKAVASCTAGAKLGAYGDVQICAKGQVVPEVVGKINVADSIYYHNVQTASQANKKVGGGSGMHVVTYMGNGKTISFNGDTPNGLGSLCDGSYYYNVQAKVLCVSCLLRKVIKESGSGDIDLAKLKQLAKEGGNQTYINYEGGVYSNIDGINTYDANAAADSLIVSIPDIKYTGPTDIMPKSVMNSMLAAVKAITDTTAQLQVLGNMATCFSNVKEGGAWHIIFSVYMTNLWMWIDGAILWVLGFVLTCVMAYYLVDISFKIGFAVMALPVVMGLWPFKVTSGKLADVISIIAKSSALFAFLTISAYYAIQLIVAGIGGTDGMQGFFKEFDGIISGSVEDDERDILIQKWKDSFNIFSSGFVLTLFACFYAYKLIGKTTGDLVEKFYPDNVFGSDSNPMHKGMTTLASAVNKVNQKYGTGLIKDIAGHQAGKLVRNTLSVPRNLAIKGFNAVKGKIKNNKGGDEQ